jgi:hypothetical protein
MLKMMSKIQYWLRLLHRVFVIIISTVSLVMAGTGIAMKYPNIVLRLVPVLDLGMVRSIHNQLSFVFTFVLFCMVISGLYMYFYPIIIKRIPKKPFPPQTPKM